MRQKQAGAWDCSTAAIRTTQAGDGVGSNVKARHRQGSKPRPVKLSLAAGKCRPPADGRTVAPEASRQGLGEALFRKGIAPRRLARLGLSDSSYRLFQKLRWPDVGPVPCLVKPLTRRALRRPNWPVFVNRLVSALTLPIVKIVARTRPLRAEVRLIQRFDDSFTALWEDLAPKFALAVRRDAAYLNWKYVSAPHVRYSIAVLRRENTNIGYAVYRHVQEPRGRVTSLVDFLTDPDDESALRHAAAVDRAGSPARPTPTRSGRLPRTPRSGACSGGQATSR